MKPQPVVISTTYITLDAFLKWVGAVQTGGEAKLHIAEGLIKVNGAVELRRGRKLYPGDTVALAGDGSWLIEAGEA